MLLARSVAASASHRPHWLSVPALVLLVRFITVDVADAVKSWVAGFFFFFLLLVNVSESCGSCPSFSSGISDGCNTEGSDGFWFLVFLGVTNFVLPSGIPAG